MIKKREYKDIKIISMKTIRAALASRRLFRNWLWAGFRFLLHMYGITSTEGIPVVCRDGSRDILTASIYFGLVFAYVKGEITSYLCGERAIMLTNGVKLPLDMTIDKGIWTAIKIVKYGWVFDEGSGYWVKDGIKFKNMYFPISEIFDEGEYSSVGVGGRVVVDVGAFVGDSAIYFALRGAKKVIAIEPHPKAFEEMLENIKLNNLEDKIVPINVGIASKPGRLCVSDSDAGSSIEMYYKQGNCEDGVPAMTLDEIMYKYIGENDEIVLKMDCEGCEYDIIMNDYENVRKFKEVVFEYHEKSGKSIKVMLNRLSKDYDCSIISEGLTTSIVRCVRRAVANHNVY